MTRLGLLLAGLAVVVGGCGDDTSGGVGGGPVVARVGDAVLSEADLADALGDVPAGLDSAASRAHVVEQWVQRELLVQEARAQGLHEDPAVRRRLAETERAALEDAALDAYFAQNPALPSDDDLQAYYDRNRDALALREPYVRLRHLRLRDRGRAGEARASFQRAVGSALPDSLFALVAQEYADDPAGAIALSGEYVSEGRVGGLDDALGARIAELPAGAQVVSVSSGGAVHLVQVVDRVPTGTVPPLRLVRDELAERLSVQRRRDAAARLLQRLRAEAQSQGRLDVRR